jgi:hypothetical protein
MLPTMPLPECCCALNLRPLLAERFVLREQAGVQFSVQRGEPLRFRRVLAHLQERVRFAPQFCSAHELHSVGVAHRRKLLHGEHAHRLEFVNLRDRKLRPFLQGRALGDLRHIFLELLPPRREAHLVLVRNRTLRYRILVAGNVDANVRNVLEYRTAFLLAQKFLLDRVHGEHDIQLVVHRKAVVEGVLVQRLFEGHGFPFMWVKARGGGPPSTTRCRVRLLR